MVDEILFFHPSGVPYDLKCHIYGWCAAMITFAKSFSAQPLEVAILDKFKVAFKQVDSIAMVTLCILQIVHTFVLSTSIHSLIHIL